MSNLVQAYDFVTGELTSRFRFEGSGVGAEVQVVTFASRTAPTIVLQKTTVQVDQACELSLRAVVEIAGLRGRMLRRRTDTPEQPEAASDGSMLWEADGGLSTCGFALATELIGGEAERSVNASDASGPLRTEYRLRAQQTGPSNCVRWYLFSRRSVTPAR